LGLRHSTAIEFVDGLARLDEALYAGNPSTIES